MYNRDAVDKLECTLNINIVWFKRDLRTFDHAALFHGLKEGQILPLYIIEPQLWSLPDMSYRHYQFLMESLKDLQQDLQKVGLSLIIKVGDAVGVLETLRSRYNVCQIFSHQETWNGWTYERDKRVKKWAKNQGVTWQEFTQNGVVRCLKDRDGWATRWYSHMKKPLLEIKGHFRLIQEPSDPMPKAEDLSLISDNCQFRQLGGRDEALNLLESFLMTRGEGYTKEMSSPVSAFDSCSRLSPHLAFGTLSMREVFQAANKRAMQLRSLSASERGRWPSAIRSFSGRLRWHCHFIQKLEDEPAIEFQNMHTAYDQLRQETFNEAYFKAWQEGKTGYPMIDACMRALTANGWLNFRMRAMLMSFASYHLWLHWRRPALHLARLFTDYEPGIHYSQVQMQSGTTGINSIRIYNPIKQGIDQDPDGVFIRRWIPELKNMSDDCIHTPWERPDLMEDYVMPIVDEKEARQAAASALYGLRKNTSHREQSRQIVKKHGSRKSTKPRKVKPKNPKQGELPL